jgi:hypothetical protein
MLSIEGLLEDEQGSSMGELLTVNSVNLAMSLLSYGPPWDHHLGGYQDRLLGGPLGLLDLRCMAPAGVKHKNYRGEVLG